MLFYENYIDKGDWSVVLNLAKFSTPQSRLNLAILLESIELRAVSYSFNRMEKYQELQVHTYVNITTSDSVFQYSVVPF